MSVYLLDTNIVSILFKQESPAELHQQPRIWIRFRSALQGFRYSEQPKDADTGKAPGPRYKASDIPSIHKTHSSVRMRDRGPSIANKPQAFRSQSPQGRSTPSVKMVL